MPAKLPDETRAAIAQALHERPEPERKRNDLAREFGVSEGMVSKIAKEEGVSFDRAQVKHATAAVHADIRARRARIAERLLDKVEHIVERVDQPYKIVGFDKDGNTCTARLDEPPAGEVRNFMVAVGIGLEKHMALELHDQPGATEAAGLIAALMAGVRSAVHVEA